MNKLHHAALIAILSTLVTYATAQSIDTTLLVFDSIQIVEITANRPFYSNQSPNVGIIDKRALTLSDPVQLAPALNRIAGVFVHNGTYGTNRITIRGIGNRTPFATAKIKAYLNEIPLTNGIGETTIEDLDLSFLEQVEVLKGPAGSLYGAGLGGMIGLSTGNLHKMDNTLRLESTLGSYGLVRNTAQATLHPNKKLAIRLNVNQTHSDGYRDNSQYYRRGLMGIFSLLPDEKNSITGIIHLTDVKGFIPSSLNQNDFENNPQAAAFPWAQVQGFEDYQKKLIGISIKRELPRFNTSLSGSFFTNENENYEVRPFNILRENSNVTGSRFLARFFPENKLSFHVGTEAFLENYQWQTYEQIDANPGKLLTNFSEDREYLNLFAQMRWYLTYQTKLVAGINSNQTDYRTTDRFLIDEDQSGQSNFDRMWSPFLLLEQKFNTSAKWINQWKSYLVVSHGFNPPTIEETLTPEGFINQEIQPEQGWNFEVGTSFETGGSSFSLSLFSMFVEDMLVARRTALDQFVGINAGKTTHQGIEMAWQYEHSIGKHQLTAFANYAYARYFFNDFVDGNEDFSGNQLTGSAPHQATAGVSCLMNNGIYTDLNYQFIDAMPLRDDNSVFSDNYQIFNWRVGYQKTFWQRWGFNGYMGINNLLNEKYASMLLINAASFGGNAPRYFYPGLPRNWYGGVAIRYTF